MADGATVAILSVATGSGLANAEAGIETGFQVQAKDIKGNLRTVGTDSVVAVLRHRDMDVTLSTTGVYDTRGLYRFRYTATVAGAYDIDVTINGAHVEASPFTLDVRPTVPFGPLFHAVGTADASTNASSSFVVTSKDRFNNTLRGGGNRLVARLTGPGVVSADPAIYRATVADHSDGTYTASYYAPRSGDYSIDVRFADGNETGLLGEYFPNQWMLDVPAHVRVDAVIDFTWPRDANLVTDGWGTIYNSVRWTGFVEVPVSEYVTFHVDADDGARLIVERERLVDGLDGPPGSRSGQLSFQAQAGLLYEVTLEYRQLTSQAKVRLQWESPSMPLEVVPTRYLFPRGIPIRDSPFAMVAV